MIDFRQTQTAISTYYTIQDGFKLNYETPVLGKPWSIPFEFPLFQWVTASLVLLSGIPLDQAGRLVSMLFFYLSLVSVYFIFKNISLNAKTSLVAICMILVSPIYIFWSRNFMIESMALCFGLAYIAFFSFYLKKGGKVWLLLMILPGILSGIVKITTFLISSIPVMLVIFYYLFNDISKTKNNAARENILLKKIYEYLGYFCLICLPYSIAYLWVLYTDSLKKINPIAADFITSKSLMVWNFGTLKQRLSFVFWERIYHWMIEYGIGSSLILLILLLAVFANRKYLKYIGLSLIAFSAGPLIFSNLYWVHDYYHYANIIFLLFAISLSIIALLENKRTELIALMIIFPLSLFSMFHSYITSYYTIQSTRCKIPSEALLIRKIIPSNDILFINGQDWSSIMPYYSQRRAIMNRGYKLNHEILTKSIGNTGENKISGFISNQKDEELISRFNLHPEPIYSNIYLRKDDFQKTFLKLFHIDISKSNSEFPIKIIYYKCDFRLFVHPIGVATVPVDGSESAFRVKFGIQNEAFKYTDGVEFVVTHVSADGIKTELFRTYLNPMVVINDRAIQERTVSINGLGKGDLLLQTYYGNSSACDWAFWSNMELF